MTNTTPEVPAELMDQVLAGWSLHLSANGGSLAQTKAAEIAIREALAYARDQLYATRVADSSEEG
ncbi:hypothetical protein ACIBHX_01785 [Nonomuraea sp. NPDC050536]|uniref:hypothetical protein n=1 Tax=Nonomuraea sp. NPDC050536 TaxID=3364366 RepID=UPI0037CA639B